MKYLNLEIADTTIKRSYGLMDRKKLGENDGMIFIFPHKNQQSFWMQNTYLPLDIAFLDDSGKVLEIKSMSPHSTRLTTSSEPCKFAVEVNRGWFSKNSIGIGFQMFKGKNWVKELKGSLSSYSHSSRFSKVAIDKTVEPNELNPNFIPEQNTQEPELQQELNPELQQEQNPELNPSENIYQQPMQPNQVIEYNMNQVSKIQNAHNNNLDMNIIYWTFSGKNLPPRRLKPIKGEGYPIEGGPNGRHFDAIDISPTIYGDGYEILGNQRKSFLIDNIIGLEIIQDKGKATKEEEQTIEEPQNLWDRLRKKIFNR